MDAGGANRTATPSSGADAGSGIALSGGGHVRLLAPYAPGPAGVGVRLWVSLIDTPEPLHAYLARHGRPIRYGYVRGNHPLSAYQNVYVTEPGSAEMPSAGRPFTPEVLTRLVAKGVGVAPLLLHTGVASLEASEPPYAEYFRVSSSTAHRVNDTRRRGGRVVAVGTTVVRALESVVDEHGQVHPGDGWTQTVVTPEHPVRSIDGFLTGWHEPEASHLAMLEAIAGRPLLEASYAAALDEGYLWHEFGDVHLIRAMTETPPRHPADHPSGHSQPAQAQRAAGGERGGARARAHAGRHPHAAGPSGGGRAAGT